MKRRLTYCLLLTSLSACGGDTGDWTPKANMRCQEDGLCITRADGKRLSGAYREGNRELGFDAVSSPSFSQSIIGGEQICVRLMYDNGFIFSSADNSSCPFGFLDRRVGLLTPEENLAYRELIPKLHVALQHHGSDEHMPQHWDFVTRLAAPDTRPPPDRYERPLVEEAMSAEEVKNFPASKAERAMAEIPTLNTLYAADAQEDMAPERLSVKANESADIRALSLSSSSSGTGWVTPSQRFFYPQYEFRQELELYN